MLQTLSVNWMRRRLFGVGRTLPDVFLTKIEQESSVAPISRSGN